MQLFNFFKNPDRFSFLSKATESQRVRYGTFMWICLFFGYFIFCFNWILMGKLSGSSTSGSSTSGWIKDLGVGSNKVLIESSMYMVSFARGIATLGVAWLMTKLSHKWATLIALFLNTISLPLIFLPLIFLPKFPLFVIGRMFMACGGTMLIILIYPVLTRFFNLEQKGKLTTFTSLAYLFAGLAVNLLFIYSGGWEEKLQKNWKMVAGVFAGLSYFPLIAYPFVGKDFLTSDNMQQDIDQLELPKNTYKGIIKEKNMWLWIFLYSFLLVASLIVSLEIPKIVNRHIGQNLKFGDNVKWSSVYSICFFVGCICGLCLGILNKKQYRRKPAVVLSFSLALLFLSAIIGASHWNNVAGASSIIFISVFFFAFFAMGIQPVILYIPHEYEENDNAKRITIFFSYLWGFGYVIFTVYQIIVAALRNGNRLRYDYMNFGFILMLIAGAIVCSLLIKEPRPQYKLHPWQK